MFALKPQAFSGGNVFVDGVGFLGTLKSVEFPKIENETLEVSGSVGKTEMILPTLKPLSAKIEVNNINQIILTSLSSVLPKVFKLKTSLSSTGLSQEETKLEALIGGNVKVAELPKYEVNSEVALSLEISVNSFTYSIDNLPCIVYDFENSIYMINGIDQYANIRKNIN